MSKNFFLKKSLNIYFITLFGWIILYKHKSMTNRYRNKTYPQKGRQRVVSMILQLYYCRGG